MPPMMPPPQQGGQPPQGTPIGATPQRPPMQPGAQQPQPGGGPGRLDPAKLANLAKALTPDNFNTFMQIMGAVLTDTYGLIQKAGQQGGAQPGAAPGQPPQGAPGPQGMATPAPQGGMPPGAGGGMMQKPPMGPPGGGMGGM